MRRSLVLTNEGFRHPMRVNLPYRRHAFADVAPARLSAIAAPAPAPSFDWRFTASDMRGFATTYFAAFAAVLAFIA